MSLIGGWSLASDPLYASSLVTLPQTQLLAADPQFAADAVVQSSDRYARDERAFDARPIRERPFSPASPAERTASVRKSLQP